MALDVWLAFVLASALLLATPGPVVTLLVATGVRHGRGAALAMVPGIFLGDLVAMVLSLAGVGVLLLASAALFAVVKWAGAAYLVLLGIRMWRDAGRPEVDDGIAGAAAGGGALAARAFLTTVLNPKSILFFAAFTPQFLDPGRPLLPQLTILGATFLTLGLLNDAFYVVLAGAGGRALGPGVRRLVQRSGAGVMIGSGILTATLRRG